MQVRTEDDLLDIDARTFTSDLLSVETNGATATRAIFALIKQNPREEPEDVPDMDQAMETLGPKSALV